MPEPMFELQSRIQQLQSRLVRATADLQRVRDQSARSGWAVPAAMAIIGAAIMFMAAASVPQKVKAPFVVVNGAGKKIFEVVETDVSRGFALYNQNEKRVVFGGSGLNDSFFKAISADASMQAAMGVVNNGKSPAFTLRYGGDAANRVSIAIVDGNPSLDMNSDKNTLIAQAGVGAAGGGYVLLLDAKTQPSVLFGVTAKNAGKVITYPNSGAGGAMAGLKGTMICGLAGCQ